MQEDLYSYVRGVAQAIATQNALSNSIIKPKIKLSRGDRKARLALTKGGRESC